MRDSGGQGSERENWLGHLRRPEATSEAEGPVGHWRCDRGRARRVLRVARDHERSCLPVPRPSLRGQALPQAYAARVGHPCSRHLYRHASGAGHHCPHSRRGDGDPWRLLVRRMGGASLLDDRSDCRIPRGLRRGAMAGRPLRSTPREPRDLAQARLHRRSRRRHYLFRDLLDPRSPEGLTCYLFGLSPMPFWVFAVVSTLGRIPGTWMLSVEGAHTAAGDYVEVILLTALVVAVALPLYYYRNSLVEWFRGKQVRPTNHSRGAS